MDPARLIALAVTTLLFGALIFAWAWITVRDTIAGVRALDHCASDLHRLVSHMAAESAQRDALIELGFTDAELACNTVTVDDATGFPTTHYDIPRAAIEARATQIMSRRAAAVMRYDEPCLRQ